MTPYYSQTFKILPIAQMVGSALMSHLARPSAWPGEKHNKCAKIALTGISVDLASIYGAMTMLCVNLWDLGKFPPHGQRHNNCANVSHRVFFATVVTMSQCHPRSRELRTSPHQV